MNRFYVGVFCVVLMWVMKLGMVFGWELLIDLFVDGGGGFSVMWCEEEGFMMNDLIGQIEVDGVEIDLYLYIMLDGYFCYQVKVVVLVIVMVGLFLFFVCVLGLIVFDFEMEDDYVVQMIGVFGFGNGIGQDWLWKYVLMVVDGIGDFLVCDVCVNFFDIYDLNWLQVVVNVEFVQ